MEVLHTWGQTLVYHPHIHVIVPTGGIDEIGKWKNSKKKFFIPVKVLSRKFRGKFLYYLKQEKLEFHGKNEYLKNKENYEELIAKMYNKEKEMTSEAEEFIRRFLMHILPPYFMKIRHYGILGNRNKKTKLAICKKLTNTANIQHQELSTLEILKKTLGVDFNLCPFCKTGHLINPDSG